MANSFDEALYDAALTGNVKKGKELLFESKAQYSKAEDGSTPLYIAAQSGHVEVMKILVESKANINQIRSDEYGATPLHVAAENGSM